MHYIPYKNLQNICSNGPAFLFIRGERTCNETNVMFFPRPGPQCRRLRLLTGGDRQDHSTGGGKLVLNLNRFQLLVLNVNRF